MKKQKKNVPRARSLVALGMAMTCRNKVMRDRRMRRPKDARRKSYDFD